MFWPEAVFPGMQDLLRRYSGIISTRVRYSGGDTPNASYRDHRDHAEAVEIIFDPKVISFRENSGVLLPNTRSNHARPEDRGRSYRSAIFYTSEAQKQVTLDTSADVKASGLWPGKVVTGMGRQAGSGRRSRSIRTIWSAIPTATPATSRGWTGNCPSAPRRKRRTERSRHELLGHVPPATSKRLPHPARGN